MTIKDIEEKLYKLNAWISFSFVTGLNKPTQVHMNQINRELGKIIKECQELGSIREDKDGK